MNNTEYYSGDDKFAYAVFCAHDIVKVHEILDFAVSNGIRIWADDNCMVLNSQSLEKLQSCDVCVFFLTRTALCSHAVRSTLTSAIELNKKIIIVYLEKVELTPCQQLQVSRAKVFDASQLSSSQDLCKQLIERKVFDGCINQNIRVKSYFLVRQSDNERIKISKDEYSIGRSETMSDYTLTGNNAISRLHVVVKKTKNGCVIIDKNSVNKTYINGKEILPMIEYQINNLDKITLADEDFVFEVCNSI